MKQLAAIFLFVLFLFNLAGYRLVFYYLDNKSEVRYESLIDNEEYDEADLLTIKVDINMPYQVERTDFQRISGEIEVDGVVYQYVKRRVYNGQLVLLCIPNNEKTKIKNAENRFVEWTNDIAASQHQKDSPAKNIQKQAFSDYEQVMLPGLSDFTFTLDTYRVLINEALPRSQTVDLPAQPPEPVV